MTLTSTSAPPRPPGGRPVADAVTRPPGTRSRLLALTLAATLASAQVEGYLQQVHPALAKLAPGLFLLTWLGHRVLTGRPVGTRHPMVTAVGVLAVVVLISTALHADNPYTLVILIRWLPFLLLTVALVDVLAHDVAPGVALNALVAGALVAAAGALFSFVVLDDARASGPLEDPNDLAYVLTAAAPIVLIRLGVARGRRAVLLAAALALLLAGSAVTVSRGGALAILSTLVLVTWRRLVPARLLAAGAALLAVLATGVLLIAADQVDTAVSQKQYIASTNIETRTLRWQAALRMLAANPVFGTGPGGAATNYVEYSGFAELAEQNPVTHQMYLEVGAELGIAGLAPFLALILGAAVATELSIRRLRRAHASPTDPLLLAAFATQASLLALCTASMFLSQEFYMPLWAALAAATALEIRTRGAGARRAVGTAATAGTARTARTAGVAR